MRSRRVVIVVFPGVLGVDAFGPADVFYFADYLAERAGEPQVPYGIEFAAAEAGVVPTAAGPVIHATRSIHDPELHPDVLLVAGGLAAVTMARDDGFVAGVAELAGRSGEVGSVCTGAVLLAAAGLLDGRRATTHWALADQVKAEYPELDVDPDRIFVHDGVWSSAGVTAGIDLALQIVQTHHGQAMAAEAARHMVVYLRRAGGQQQYSTHLAAQESVSPTLGDLLSFIADHPAANLSVAALAEQANMSERSFQRLFSREVGVSPGKFVERTRIDAARRLLEQADDGVAGIAGQCGFANVETFHRSFKRLSVSRPSSTAGDSRADGGSGVRARSGPQTIGWEDEMANTTVRQLRLVVEAEDFEEAVAFYRDALGLGEEFVVDSEGGPRVVALQAGRATLEIVNPAQRRLIDELEVGREVSRSLRVAFEVDDAKALTDKLVAAGASLIAAPTETPWRSLNSRLEAPAGLQLTLFEELGATG